MNPFGILAALATAVSWAACGLFFTAAGRRVGLLSMNHYRTLFGALMLMAAHIAVFGQIWPNVSAHNTIVLVISGIIGVVIGDIFGYQAFMDVGTRFGMLLINISPIFTAILAQQMLNEKLGSLAWLGMIITISGVFWVVAEENTKQKKVRSPHYLRGILFGVLAAVCQAIGFVIAKPAMLGTHAADPLTAALIRVGSAAVCFWLIGFAKQHTIKTLCDFKNTKAMLMTFGGAVLGPFLGIWLSLAALKLIPAGIAATLISTIPIVVLPMVIIVHKEKVSLRAAIGAIIAVAGIAILLNS